MLSRRQLGATGLEVSRLALGTVKFGRNEGVRYPQPFELPSDAQLDTLIGCAAELGVNLLDTAPAYGHSETRLGRLLAELSGGSVGEALRLLKLDGGTLYRHLVSVLGEMPGMDRQRAIALAETAAGRGAEARFDLLIRLVTMMLARLARSGAAGPPPEAAPGEAETLARLCPGPEAARGWADLEQELSDRMRHGQAVNLDPAALILDTMLRINDRAARLAAG